MIQIELYEVDQPTVVVTKTGDVSAGAWSRLQEKFSRGILGGSPDRLDVSVDTVLSELSVLREIRSLYGVQAELGPSFRARISILAEDRRERETATANPFVDSAMLVQELKDSGFGRILRDFQVNNLSKVSTLPHAADFSVPGAGKTTVALANFALQRHRGRVRRLLVVAPLAAFAAWKEETTTCFFNPPLLYVHTGTELELPSLAEIVVTNYHRLVSDYQRLRRWVSTLPTQVILDEAHRMKRGREGAHGNAALNLAFAAKRRDVLTGTPTPQGATDIVAMVSFLYPGQAKQILPGDTFFESKGRDIAVLDQTNLAIRRYFVRTCKSELGLPPTEFIVVSQGMGKIQGAIYSALIGKYRSVFQLGDTSRQLFRQLGQIVMYLLEAATNPSLLTAGSDRNDLPNFSHHPIDTNGDERLTDLLVRYPEFEIPWKYKYVEDAIQKAAIKGEKVIIWTTFVRNIRILHRLLSKWNPAMVHGGVPPRDGAPASIELTREDELDRFRNDPKCTVLLANPAACGEGVSLHHWCHHAIYLDRTFNAGHFLQSQDRIHRLGLSPGTHTKFTILISKDSIDEIVDDRLRLKVTALARLVDDPGLSRVSLPEEDPEEVDTSTDMDEFDREDAIQILRRLSEVAD